MKKIGSYRRIIHLWASLYLLLPHDEHAAVVEPLLAAAPVVRPLAVAPGAREKVPRAVR